MCVTYLNPGRVRGAARTQENSNQKLESHQNAHHLFLCFCLCISFILFYCTCTQEGSTLLSEIQKLLGKVLLGWPSGSDSNELWPERWGHGSFHDPTWLDYCREGAFSKRGRSLLPEECAGTRQTHSEVILPSLKYYWLRPVKGSLGSVMLGKLLLLNNRGPG